MTPTIIDDIICLSPLLHCMNLIDELLTEASPREQQRVRDRMLLAARIADALAGKNWTQKRLADEMGKSPSEISKWLSGTHNFTIDTLSDLSIILGVKLLCVKEEAPRIETRVVKHYEPVYIVAQGQGKNFVSLSSFQRSIMQNQPHG